MDKKTVRRIFERDIDLLIIEEFKCNPAFAKLFIDKTGWTSDYASCEAYHSLSTSNGETDITIILNYADGSKRAIMIEDKINAPTQAMQSQRYTMNGDVLQNTTGVIAVKTFLCAPIKYIKNHSSDENLSHFKCRITYEELRDFFLSLGDLRSLHKADLLSAAIDKIVVPGTKVIDADITEFWKQLRAYTAKHYPDLVFVSKTDEKSTNDQWVNWRTPVKGALIYWKADRGFIDLQVRNASNRIDEFQNKYKGHLLPDMTIEQATKSAVFRLKNPCWQINFKVDFADNIKLIDNALRYANLMYAFSMTLDRYEFEE